MTVCVFVKGLGYQRPLEWRSAILRAQNTSEGYSVRFCGVYERLIGELENRTMEFKQLYRQIIS